MSRVAHISITGLLFLSACTQESKLALLVANNEINVYPNTTETQKVKFKLSPGEVCTVGTLIEEKAFSYRKVLCENGKTGYIKAKADKSYTLLKEN
jgi:hypothetical protein